MICPDDFDGGATDTIASILDRLSEPEAFELWWDEYARANRVALDTRMIHFAEEVWMATLGEVRKGLGL